MDQRLEAAPPPGRALPYRFLARRGRGCARHALTLTRADVTACSPSTIRSQLPSPAIYLPLSRLLSLYVAQQAW